MGIRSRSALYFTFYDCHGIPKTAYKLSRDTANPTIEVVAPGLANNPTLIVSGGLMPSDDVVTKLIGARAYRVLFRSQCRSRASESTPWRALLTLKGVTLWEM